MKSRVILVGSVVFFLGFLAWLSIPSTKVLAQSTDASAQAKCVENCNDIFKTCHDSAVDNLTKCLGLGIARDTCLDIYEAAQKKCKANHDTCIDHC